MVRKGDTLKEATGFDAGIQVVGDAEFQVGSTVVAFAAARFAPCKITALQWKVGKETGGKKVPNPTSVKFGEAALCSFQPLQLFVCEPMGGEQHLMQPPFFDEKMDVATQLFRRIVKLCLLFEGGEGPQTFARLLSI